MEYQEQCVSTSSSLSVLRGEAVYSGGTWSDRIRDGKERAV